jgi:Mrp family chromosome partitioning ATPase/uncharacterized protein involved in exopolysaccharide biosynthesis
MDTLRTRDIDDIAALEQPSIVAAMWRYRWLVLLMVGIFVGLGFVFQAWVPAGFRATAAMTVEDPRTSSFFDAGDIPRITGQTPQRYVADQVEILTGNEVAQQASEKIAQEGQWTISTSEFLGKTSVSSNRDSNQIEVSFTGDTAERAADGANAIVAAYREVRLEQLTATGLAAVTQIQERERQLEEAFDEIEGQIEDLRASDATLVRLESEFQEDLLRFTVLQDQLERVDPSSDEAEDLRTQLVDVNNDLETFEIFDRIGSRDPNLRALQTEQTKIINEIADLSGRANSILIDIELQGAGITSFSPALIPTQTTGSGPIRILAASLVLGLAVAAAISYFLASRRRAFNNRALPELVLNAPLLAEVPDFTLEGIKSSLPVTHAPTSASAEAFRFAAAAVDIRASAAGAKSLMMVSATLGSGKTTAAANTAIAAARDGLRVLVIDADFGNQELTNLFVGDEQPPAGITEVVEGVVPLEKAVTKVVVTEERSLYLLWRGRRPVEAASFFRTEETQRFFAEVKNQFDLVIIDGPPLLQVAYASTLVRYVDAVTVIVAHGSRVGELEEVADRLHFIETPPIGYVYTKAPLRAEMTASEGSMKDILGVGGRPAEPKRRPAGVGARRRAGNGGREDTPRKDNG